jgi:MraZ protein
VAFRGTFDQKLDAKNRLTIPARLRAALADGVVLAIPPDELPCVWIARPDDYQSYAAQALAELSPLSAERLELERFFFGNSHDAELDSAGRIMVPAFQLQHARLDKDVVVVGAGSRLELWDSATWSEHRPALLSGVGQITRAAGHAG